MENKAGKGKVLMIAGAVLVGAALFLLLHNLYEDHMAGQIAGALLPDVQAAAIGDQNQGLQRFPGDDMTVREIDGQDYIGYLSIPALDLELPVMSSWDEERLKIAPCRHFGSTWNDNLVIAGHNYKRHFGFLSKLERGDGVFLPIWTALRAPIKLKKSVLCSRRLRKN
jgi:sortase A